jgi:hypothetical protein
MSVDSDWHVSQKYDPGVLQMTQWGVNTKSKMAFERLEKFDINVARQK